MSDQVPLEDIAAEGEPVSPEAKERSRVPFIIAAVVITLLASVVLCAVLIYLLDALELFF